MSPSCRTLTLKSLSPRLALTYTASSILRVFWQQQHAKAASLLCSSGDAPTAFLCLYSAKSAVKSHISFFLFIEFKKWGGKYFIPSWLHKVGVCLQFGHSGDPCLNQMVHDEAFYILNSFKTSVKDGF